MNKDFQEISNMLEKIVGGNSETELFNIMSDASSEEDCHEICVKDCPKTSVTGVKTGVVKGVDGGKVPFKPITLSEKASCQ